MSAEQPRNWDELERRVELREPLPNPVLCPLCGARVLVQYTRPPRQPAAAIDCTGCKRDVRVCGFPTPSENPGQDGT